MKHGCMLPHDWFPKPVPANFLLGPRSWCYSSFSFLHFRSRLPAAVRVGHDTGIYDGTFFDLGPEGEVDIGNFCTLVGAIISSNSRIEIGDFTFLAHEVVLADTAFAAPFRAKSPRSAFKRDSSGRVAISIGPNCWVGARAVILAGASLGEGAIVGAAAVVDFAVPDFAIAAGNPAKIVGSARR